MSKDPAFLFYTQDFLVGTMYMTDEQVGIYIRLLCNQHQKGKLTEKDMKKICKVYDEDIYSKFVEDGEGNYFNVRLYEETMKRSSYVNNRMKNFKKRKSDEINNSSGHMESHMDVHMETHTENENENENEDVNVNEVIQDIRDKFNTEEEYEKYVNLVDLAFSKFIKRKPRGAEYLILYDRYVSKPDSIVNAISHKNGDNKVMDHMVVQALITMGGIKK